MAAREYAITVPSPPLTDMSVDELADEVVRMIDAMEEAGHVRLTEQVRRRLNARGAWIDLGAAPPPDAMDAGL